MAMPLGAHIESSSPRPADRRKFRATPPESACGSKEFNPPFPFPPGASRGGAGSPHAEARCAPAQTAVTHRCTRLPPQEGWRPLVHPLRARSCADRSYETTGTFYLAENRNFLFGLDNRAVSLSKYDWKNRSCASFGAPAPSVGLPNTITLWYVLSNTGHLLSPFPLGSPF